MEYRALGNSGLLVSPICLGAMMFGDQTDERVAGQIINTAKDSGVNFIDTANVYAGGNSERIVGKLIKRNRDDWVLATKVGSPNSALPSEKAVSRKRILLDIDASLERLGTDYVDIYYLHRDYLEVPLEETLGTLADLIRQGKIRYWGVSNLFAWRLVEMVLYCERLGMPMPVVAQPCYNAMYRTMEMELLPACEHFGVGVVPYSPLARGVLTGKYSLKEAPPKNTRAGRKDKMMMTTEFRRESLAMAQKIKTRAERRGMTAGQFAMNWVLNNALVTSIIAGPRTMAQWKDYLDALNHSFTAADETFMGNLVPSGFDSTPFYFDPKLPPLGRVPRA